MNNELTHHGVLGQKWGVRRTPEQLGQKKIRKEQKKFEKNVARNWHKSYNKATKQFNSELIDINKRYEGVKTGTHFETKAGQKYVREVSETWKNLYVDQLLNDFGYEPISKGKDWVNNAPLMNTYDNYIWSFEE